LILDGQHRINGMLPRPEDNPIPLFCYQYRCASYTGNLLATIFAQVTTSATELDRLHHEWLTFAFEPRTMTRLFQDADDEPSAMEVVASLCNIQRSARQVPPTHSSTGSRSTHISLDPWTPASSTNAWIFKIS
jgi:hypothetical protein